MVYLKVGLEEFKFNLRPENRLKRIFRDVAGDATVVLDGNVVPVWFTSNAAFATEPDKVVERIWLRVGDKFGYLAIDLGMPARYFAGLSFEVCEGKCSRKDPEYVRKASIDGPRIEKFRATMAAKY